MAKGYRPVQRNQPFLLPPDMREWLPADHPVYLVIEVVDHHLDTRGVHATRRAGRAGAAGYDPDMLTALLVWAYANRVTSSRRIEQLCRTDVAFRLISAGQVPDHVTIARFRAGLGAAAAELFDQVLILCAKLGMGRLGVITLDGTRVKASASKSANRSEEHLRELAAQIAAEHAATDAAEDALFGAARGDELPPELADPRSREQRIAAALASLQAGRDAGERDRQDKARDYLAGPGRGKPPAEARLAAAERRLARAAAEQQALAEDWHARQAASIAAGKGRLPGTVPAPPGQSGRVARARAALAKARAAAGATPPRPAAGRGPQRNITDPHSRLQPVSGGGFIQGYNPQNVTSADGLIIATELTAGQNDAPWFEPMLARAERAAKLIAANRPGADSQIGLILADAGYLSDHNLALPGPDRLIATGKRRELGRLAGQDSKPAGRAGSDWHSPAIAAMTARLASDDGHAAYRHRGHIAETPHGDIKHNKGFGQFSVRGKPRVTAEWMLITTVTNLFKAISSGHLTTAALASITPTPA